MTKQCSQNAQEPCPKGFVNCKKVVKDKVVKMWIRNHACRKAGFVVRVDKFNEYGRKSYPCTVRMKASDYEKLRKNK